MPVIREEAGKASYSLFKMGRLHKTMRELGVRQDCRMEFELLSQDDSV